MPISRHLADEVLSTSTSGISLARSACSPRPSNARAPAVVRDLPGVTYATTSFSRLGDADAVLVVDETGDLKKGVHTVGVQRQYTALPRRARKF